MTMSDMFGLDGKTAIVTGGGYGLGKNMAIALSQAGANVMLAGRSEDKLTETAAEINARGGKAHYHVFDARDELQCQQLIEATVRKFQKLDTMVVNHGVIVDYTPEQTSAPDWQTVIETNLNSCFYCTKAAGQQMIKQGNGGSIIMTSSNGSFISFDGLAAYGASKGGVDQLCRQLASEWGPHGIRVNTINPGYTDNPMGGKYERVKDPVLDQKIAELTPLGRRGKAEEMAGPVVFLASEAASFITGHCLTVDGGYAIR